MEIGLAVISERWECGACGVASLEAARLFCSDCDGYHEICLQCARDVPVDDGSAASVSELLTWLRGGDEPHGGLTIVSVGGEGAFCSRRLHS